MTTTSLAGLVDYLAALALELQAHDRRDHDPGDEDRS